MATRTESAIPRDWKRRPARQPVKRRIGDMRGLQPISYSLLVAFCYRHLPPSKSQKVRGRQITEPASASGGHAARQFPPAVVPRNGAATARALRAAVGALDPCRDDARVAGPDNAAGVQPVQAGAHRALGQARCSGPGWPPPGMRPGRRGWPGRRARPCTRWMAGRRDRPEPGPGSAPTRSPRRSPGTAARVRSPANHAPRRWAQFRSHSPPVRSWSPADVNRLPAQVR